MTRREFRPLGPYPRPGWMMPIPREDWTPGLQAEREATVDSLMDLVLAEAMREWAAVRMLREAAPCAPVPGRSWYPPVVRAHAPGQVIVD